MFNPFKSRKAPVINWVASIPESSMPPADVEKLKSLITDPQHDAVAAGLNISPMPDIVAGLNAGFIPDGTPYVVEPATPAPLSPEYHAGLASRMIERLDADEARLTDALEAEQREHDTLMAALTAERAGVRRVREAYNAVRVVLQPVEPAPLRDVQDVEALVINPTPAQRRARKPAEPLKLYVGCFIQCENGQIVGPMMQQANGQFSFGLQFTTWDEDGSSLGVGAKVVKIMKTAKATIDGNFNPINPEN